MFLLIEAGHLSYSSSSIILTSMSTCTAASFQMPKNEFARFYYYVVRRSPLVALRRPHVQDLYPWIVEMRCMYSRSFPTYLQVFSRMSKLVLSFRIPPIQCAVIWGHAMFLVSDGLSANWSHIGAYSRCSGRKSVYWTPLIYERVKSYFHRWNCFFIWRWRL